MLKLIKLNIVLMTLINIRLMLHIFPENATFTVVRSFYRITDIVLTLLKYINKFHEENICILIFSSFGQRPDDLMRWVVVRRKSSVVC